MGPQAILDLNSTQISHANLDFASKNGPKGCRMVNESCPVSDVLLCCPGFSVSKGTGQAFSCGACKSATSAARAAARTFTTGSLSPGLVVIF